MKPLPLLLDSLGDVGRPLERISVMPNDLRDEAWLQELLYSHAELLPVGSFGDSFSPPIPLGREVRTRSGAILIMVLVALALLTALGGTLLRWASMEHKLLRSQAEAGQARWLAEAGVERAAARLAHDLKYAGETWDIAAADLPAGAAARVRIVVKPLAGHTDRSSIMVDVEYPLESDVASRAHKEVVFPIQAEET